MTKRKGGADGVPPPQPTVEERDPNAWPNVLKYLTEGHSKTDACAMAGIRKDAFYRHVAANEEFRLAVARAQIGIKSEYMMRLRQEAAHARSSGDRIKALTWLLEKGWPAEFGSRARLDVNTRDVSKMNAAEVAAEMRRVADELENGGDDDDGG